MPFLPTLELVRCMQRNNHLQWVYKMAKMVKVVTVHKDVVEQNFRATKEIEKMVEEGQWVHREKNEAHRAI